MNSDCATLEKAKLEYSFTYRLTTAMIHQKLPTTGSKAKPLHLSVYRISVDKLHGRDLSPSSVIVSKCLKAIVCLHVPNSYFFIVS